MGDDGPVKDVAEAIERVMTKAHKKSELRKMGMYDPVDGKFKPISSY